MIYVQYRILHKYTHIGIHKLSYRTDAGNDGNDDASYAHHATLNPDSCYQQQCVEHQQRLDVCSGKLE